MLFAQPDIITQCNNGTYTIPVIKLPRYIILSLQMRVQWYGANTYVVDGKLQRFTLVEWYNGSGGIYNNNEPLSTLGGNLTVSDTEIYANVSALAWATTVAAQGFILTYY